MKEVSCRVFEIFMKPLARKGVSVAAIVEGTGVTVEALRDQRARKKERIDWAQFVAVMRNMRPHFTDDEYVELGRSFMHSPALRFAFVVARLAFSPIDIYRWSNKPRDGLGNQMFTCVIPDYQERSANEIVLELTLPEGYERCWDFFVIVRGNNEELPRLFGLPRAHVQLTAIPRGARYEITVPTWRVPLLKRIVRLLAWPFTARAAARELKEAHETLIARYAELEDARMKLDRQAARLRTAHTLNEIVHRDLDRARMLENIVRVLVEEAAFASAELVIDRSESATHGQPTEIALARSLLSTSGSPLGSLAVTLPHDSDRTEREDLLAFIVPTLSIALENASYRTNLERLVDTRTVELRQARDELTGTVAQLREANGARERFFGHISHEIRTPLTIITLAASDVAYRAGDVLDARSRRNLDSVNEAARKLVRLVDELLLLAAGQEGKLRTNPEPTDVAELLRRLESAWHLAVEKAGLSIASRVPEVLIANVDPVAIERVVSNLISNAVKYTPRGGAIELALVDGEDGLRLSVFDTGPGIDEELRGRLFSRFERGREGASRRQPGTGLGLALSKHLVEAHGGTIDALPRPEGGSELRVVLPRELVVRDAVARVPVHLRLVDKVPAPADGPMTAAIGPAERARGTVLLAEDDVRLADLVARLLADEYTVVVAHDGLTALELAREHQPQLLITDIDMPGLDGMELARRFRELTGDRLAPIIILSAMLDLGTRLAGIEAGAVDYVTKPFDPLELVARVGAQFRARELAVRLHRAEQVSALGILTSGLAHELRNPANAIANAIEPLVQKLPAELVHDEHAVGQLLQVIRECAEQIRVLSRQLLGVRGQGEMELDVRAVPLRDVVQRAVGLSHAACVGIEVRIAVDPVTVRCAAPLLTQALTNLLENAGHAAGAGGWVELRATADEEALVIEVSDSGPGVPTALRERVFEPFFTTKPDHIGTGLGLALVRDIVRRHRGTIEIRDRPQGSAFVIALPGVCVPMVAADAI